MDHKKILTPFQYQLLQTFFAKEKDGKQFFLTGGTALSAFYLAHRYSEDIDLFTTESFHPTRIVSIANTLAKELKVSIVTGRASETYHQFFFKEPDGNMLKVEWVQDTAQQFGSKKEVDGVIIDDLGNIASNKICAIYSRREAKDFVDLYFLLNEKKVDFFSIIEDAKAKDGGITEFYLAGMLLEVKHLKDLPRMIKPLTIETLHQFFQRLADDLLDRIKPISG